MNEPFDLTYYFGSFRAEMEASWLAQAHLSPHLFGQMIEPRSIVIMGEDGSGKTIRFKELFGPGVTEQDTTQKLISASHNSLARMLKLGNRLLQEHCSRAVIEIFILGYLTQYT